MQSERYLSDLHFYKEGTFIHRLTNPSKEGETVTALVQEYFPKFLKPYLHELKILKRELDTDAVKEVKLNIAK